MTISDINAFARFLSDSDTTSYTAANLLITVNNAYEEVVGKIIVGTNGGWNFDDFNFTTHPIATTTLVSGQQDYAFDTSLLILEGLDVLTKDGIYLELFPIDKSEIRERFGIALSEYAKTNGLPREYDKQGSSVFLYPAPDNGITVTLAAGLKAYFKRTASIYTSAEVTTGTKTPGFASPFHPIISYMAALPYCMNYKKDRVSMLMNFIGEWGDQGRPATGMKKQILDFYSRRSQDERSIMTGRKIKYI